MMDQLLERDGGPPHVIADVLETSVDETHHDSQVPNFISLTYINAKKSTNFKLRKLTLVFVIN